MKKALSIALALLLSTSFILQSSVVNAVADVLFSFDSETASLVEFGFTGSTVSSMDSTITIVENTWLSNDENDAHIYSLDTSLYAFWRILSTNGYVLSIKREAAFDDVQSQEPDDVIYFSMTCGGKSIPADTAVEIYSHAPSLEPVLGYLPISVTTNPSNNINTSYYTTTLTLELKTI